MENDRIGVSKNTVKKKRLAKGHYNSKSQKLAEQEYEAYYNKIRMLSRGQ